VDVSAWLLRHTPPRPMVVTAPGGTAARLAVERAARARGWTPAVSPAEANILVVAGRSGHALEPYVRRVWDLFPAPRARADVVEPTGAPHRLDLAAQALGDADRQREQAARPAPAPAEHGGHDSHHEMTASEQHGGHSHDGHEMGGMDMPGGVPMADRAEDRDGLKLDQLHVPLGPLLPLWPAGLIVHTRLQGDVIQDAVVELLDPGHGSFWAPPSRATAHHLDASARLLTLAGWVDAAEAARRLRDEALDGAPVAAPVRKWARRVRRSRTLRWLLAGMGEISNGPPSLDGDALARLHRRLEQAIAESSTDPGIDETQWTVEALPALLEGADLATARLIVASLDLDLDVLTHAGAHHD
jgi:hypothetical protein